MAYLIITDYKKQIQTDNLQQIIGNDLSVLQVHELAAIEEAEGSLKPKYDTAQEFQDTSLYDPAATYKAGNRVYDDATNYNIYSAIYPQPLFSYQTEYKLGDKVFWKDKLYTALKASVDWGENIQFRLTENLPLNNQFPDHYGQTQWQFDGDYFVPAGKLSDIQYFEKRDNRSQLIVMLIVDIALFHLHSRIAPRSVPDLRKLRYENAIALLKSIEDGHTITRLPAVQPKTGARIRFGGAIKNINSY